MTSEQSRSGLDRVLTAWRLSPANHTFDKPADDEAIAKAEQALGRALPDGLTALYRFSNGMAALGGNLMVEPMTEPEDGGLVGYGDRLRGLDWPIPDQVLMFGGNGADELFGLWYPPGAPVAGPTPVVMVGSVFEPACLALVGTDLHSFLLSWSAFYLVLAEAPAEALDALGLPETMPEIDDGAPIAPFFQWADPTLTDPEPNPYERGIDAAAMAASVARLAGR